MRSRQTAAIPWTAALVVLIAQALSPHILAGSASKSQIQHPDDTYIHSGGSLAPGWVKFLILTSAPGTVYFQDSNLYAFHYDFAVNELPQFAGMTPTQFDNVTLYAAGQQAILGAVLIPPTAGGVHVIPEYGIQLVRQDLFTAVETRDILLTVAANVIAAPQVQPHYIPSFEQLQVAEANEAYFASEGFPVSSTARWADGNACYSHGWALGTLKFFTAGQIDAAFLAGTLTSDDILLTDGIPAEIPFLAGVLSLSPSTPNSHVSLLTQTFNVPFAFLADTGDAQHAQSLVGHRVALRVSDRFSSCQVRVANTDDELDQATVDSILDLKAPPALNISVTQPYGAYSTSTNGLVLSDIQYFGGKAANFGILRQSIPLSSPVSTAFSFDLWNEFLDQVVPGGGLTLRQEIAQQLAPFTYPPDIATLDNVLNDIRDRIRDDTTFSSALTSTVLATLQDAQYGFDANRKLRFRSSTNVEDSDQFTGAGLYDSFSGCLADDLDGNDSGPSICDPGQNNERGVFRAIQKVFASFYNLNAFLERLRHGIDENDVGMALLVHHSFPDPIELANGVATFTLTSSSNKSAYLVLQPGANSVTNPEPGQIPEEVDVFILSSGSIFPTVIQESNLVALGDTVLSHPDEYVTLTEYLIDAEDHYALVTALPDFVLEFEFKKTAPNDDLIVTQVRRVPQPDTTPSLTPFLLNEPTEYCLFQGEFSGGVFGNHRMKSRWDIETQSQWLTLANLQIGFYDETSLEYFEGCLTLNQQGSLPTWPAFSHSYTTGQTDDSWSFDDLQNPRTYTLQTNQISELLPPAEGPFVFLRDFGWPYDYTDNGCLPVKIDYITPVPEYDFSGPIATATDYILLCPCRNHETTDIRVDRVHTDSGITIETSYYWPEPIDVAAGYTAPLIEFIETTITGLTPQPIVLTGEYAQTYKPGHHNFTAEYLYEPALDPGVSQQTLDDLAFIDVRAIYVFEDFGAPRIATYSESQWTYHCLPCRGPDVDGDAQCLHGPTFDCDDTNLAVWSDPGEVSSLDFSEETLLTWTVPADLGGNAVFYDTLRAVDAADFLTATCIDSDGNDTQSSVTFTPPTGSIVYFLVRAENDCPDGLGTLGHASSGAERFGVACP